MNTNETMRELVILSAEAHENSIRKTAPQEN